MLKTFECCYIIGGMMLYVVLRMVLYVGLLSVDLSLATWL